MQIKIKVIIKQPLLQLKFILNHYKQQNLNKKLYIFIEILL